MLRHPFTDARGFGVADGGSERAKALLGSRGQAQRLVPALAGVPQRAREQEAYPRQERRQDLVLLEQRLCSLERRYRRRRVATEDVRFTDARERERVVDEVGAVGLLSQGERPLVVVQRRLDLAPAQEHVAE